MKNLIGRITSILHGSTLDGPGIRSVVFLSGCNMRCPFCHNPETFFNEMSKQISSNELVLELLKYENYIKSGGVTLSGGEPFLQSDFCSDVIDGLHSNNIHVAIQTNGTIIDENLISKADLLIVDIKNYTKEIPKEIYDFLKICNHYKKNVYLTNVLIEGVNDDTDSIKLLRKIYDEFNIKTFKFLPFKKLCEDKYNNLNMVFPYKNIEETSDVCFKKAIETFNFLEKGEN